MPHLTEKAKADILASTLPYLKEARTTGSPSLSAGAIYPIPLDDIQVKPFAVPRHWPRVYAMDPGWNRTAAVWGAIDRTVDVVYLYTEHYRAHAEPSVHAAAIKARGEWIPGVMDPAGKGRQVIDGRQVIFEYRALGLHLTEAINAVEAGLQDVWDRLSTGRLKVFSTLQNWAAEYRLYRRNEEGKIVKEFDHLMDATRYLVVSGLNIATAPPPKREARSGGVGDSTVGY